MNSPVSASSSSSDSGLPDEDAIEDLAYKLKEETLAALQRRNPEAGLADAICKNVLSMAYRRKLIGLLNAMLRNASESDHPLTEVLSTYNMLLRNHVPEPDLYLTPTHIALKLRVHNVISETAFNKHAAGDRTNVIEAMCSYAITADPEDQPLIEQIIIQRRMTLPDEVAAILPEIRNCAYALSNGSL